MKPGLVILTIGKYVNILLPCLTLKNSYDIITWQLYYGKNYRGVFMQTISFKDVEICEGFWKQKQTLNKETAIFSVYERFSETGRFDAFNFDWVEGQPNKPHFFWDSDVAKWIEGAAYILQKEKNPKLEAMVDEVVDKIAEHQDKNGYFNIYFTVVEPEKRFSNRDCHELYCAGHLTEAAIAYYDATGKDKMLKCMCRYMDLIEKVFVKEHSASFTTPGHEEIELALVRLYHCTGERRYLELSEFFINNRGAKEEILGNDWTEQNYYQSHKPCREQHTAQGHSVRACYLYSGMADIALECSDKELKTACKDIFDDIYTHKLYITGGIGQSSYGEAFTVPYDLQNDRAYTETCAAIALVYFAHRMQKLELDSRYGDVIEKAIYNGILSGISLDGKSFFYENPLEIILSENKRNVSVKNKSERHPITQRVEVFNCSCCPPNLNRFIASIGDYIYGADDDTIYIHQYISSTALINEQKISMQSGFPYDGKINISIKNGKTLALRIPSYSRNKFSININGKQVTPIIKNGYAFVNTEKNAEITLTLDISPKKVFANGLVSRDAGKCAIVAGPLVYCAEGKDNGNYLRQFRIPDTPDFSFEKNGDTGTIDIIVKAEKAVASDELYSFEKKYEKCDLHLIPYFAFANRGEWDMAVWLVSI